MHFARQIVPVCYVVGGAVFPLKKCSNGHWNESMKSPRMFPVSRFSLKIPCILKHRGSSWHELTGGGNSIWQVVAPVGFTFQRTCGYWVLSRAGSAHQGLPPGGLNDLNMLCWHYLILKRHWRDEHFFQVKRCEMIQYLRSTGGHVLCAWRMWQYLGRIWSW